MKSLKKTLSLVLVLVMVFGLFGVANASFTDDSTIQYKEAVDVMTGIGAINGYADGTFKPAGTITREEAAKMVAYAALGSTIASTLSVTSTGFADVAATRWSAPYIAYCVSKNIINGVGDDKFDPTGNVTGYQLAKMMLCAAGYGKQDEYVGASWSLNVAIDAHKLGIFTGTKATNLSAAATREEAALYIFNALTKIEQVVWNKTTENYQPADTTAAVDNTIAISVYALTSAVGMDDFGRPNSRAWTYKGNVISSQVTVTPKLTYTSTVSGAKIFADLGLTANKDNVTTYTDGKANVLATFDVAYNNTATVGGNGALTEVYVDAAGAITIVTINTYIGTVTTVTPATAVSKATVTVTAKTVKLSTFASGAIAATGYKVNDVVLYTVAETAAGVYAVKSVAAATKATVSATSYVTGTSFVAGGTTYTYSAKNNGTPIAVFTPKDIYLDSYGYVIDVTGATVAANYAVVLAAGVSSDGLGGTTYNVKLLKTDGTTEVVKGAADYSVTADGWIGSIVTYSVSATTGAYTLTNPTSSDYATVTGGTTLALSLKNSVSAFTWTTDHATAGTTTTFYANANTVFLVRTGAAPYTYTAYTGIASVPSLSGAAVGQVVVNSVTGFADVVYITSATAGTAAEGTVYLTGTYKTTVDSVKGTYYTSNAIVNGAVTTVDLGLAPVKGLYTGIVYNANNVGTIGSAATVSTATGTKALSAGVIGFGAAYFTPAADCAVYYISAVTGTTFTTGIGSVSSLAGLLTDGNDTVIYTTNTAGLVTAIYVQVDPAV